MDDTSTVEQEAFKVVNLIQQFVEILRSVPEFAVGSSAKTLDTVCLDEHFEHLLPQIRPCCGAIDNISTPLESSDQRIMIVSQVLWPLLSYLGQCYAVLDKLPTRQQAHQRSQQQPKHQKPPPPPGLLSIQNYTDIAVLMEFLVCTSILPLLQQNVLLEASDRARYSLPKSLAGRIPRHSLLWGCSVVKTSPTTQTDVSRVILELRTTVTIMGQVVLLDRFRPMLLPRHVVDLYAAIFQSDALEQQLSQTSKRHDDNSLIPTNYINVVQALLPERSSSGANTKAVDTITQARAYQTLLSRGTSAPLWLRQRVSSLLNELASQDLAALVFCFVQAAGEERMTSASLRLARALTASQEKENVEALCQQLVSLLNVPDQYEMGTPLDPSTQAGVLTVLAVIDQLSVELLLEHFFSLFTNDLVPIANGKGGDSKSLHQTIRRLGLLMSLIPPSSNSWKIGRLLLAPIKVSEPLQGTRVTIFSQLLRVATIESAAVLRVKDDAVFALQCATQTLIQSSFPSVDNESIPSEEVAALALMYSLAPTSLDAQGYHYAISGAPEGESDTLQDVILVRRPESSLLHVANDIERMSNVVVEKVLLPLTKRTVDGSSDGNQRNATEEKSSLPSTMFHLLLLSYFSTSTFSPDDKDKTRVGLPGIFMDIRVYIQLVTMVLLPLVCEKCSPESLLITDGSGVGILSIMAMILDCSSSAYERTLSDGANTINTPPTNVENGVKAAFRQSSDLLAESLLLTDADCDDVDEDVSDMQSDETWTSISSIVLTLLVAMLELGSQKRSEEEESLLSSMLPSLEALATFRKRNGTTEKESYLFQPEFAEVAAHAMALIASRSQTPFDNDERHPKQQSIMDRIKDAEKDLESEQPPIRARGVAMLTRISRMYAQKKEQRLRDQPLVTIVDDEGDDKESDELSLVLNEILRVSVVALADKESYVYLAAIQSIVSAGDVAPREVIPVIGHAICTGTMSFDSYYGSESELTLNLEQRIKLTEALLFTIRRRGKAIYEFVPLLMNIILCGAPDLERNVSSEVEARTIREQTHRYFVQGSNPTELSEDKGMEPSSRKEVDIRVRAGGPVFQMEESDVLRAGCVSVLAELVASTHPSVVARHCFSLIYFATNSLNLEMSRPVRRATALLCYELYSAIIREQDDKIEINADSFAVQMASSGEEELHSALKRCVEANDNVVTTGNKRRYDPAAVERCKEALDARSEAERLGVIAAAELFILSTKQDSSPAAEIVRTRLSEGKDKSGGDVVTAMKGLEVDEDSLAF